MNTYYISAQGLDTNDGLSPETPFKTVEKVHSVMQGGDTALFRRGDTFYGEIRPPEGTEESPTTFGAYGDGKKPVISAYKTVKPGAWEKVDRNIYKVDLSDISKFDGCICNPDGNAGFIKADGRIYGRRCFSVDSISAQWDFYTSDEDDRTVFVWSEKSPDEMADDIKIACNIPIVFVNEYNVIKDLSFVGTGANGLTGRCRHIYVSDCEFHEIGGSRLNGFGNNDVRYGNGVEFWGNSRYCTVKNCLFSEIYDVAMTMQGPHEKDEYWEDVFFTGNTVWNCTQAFEIWAGGNQENSGFKNCTFDGNVCVDCGKGWGGEYRPDQWVRCPLLMYHLDNPLCDVKVFGNTFSGSHFYTILKSGGFSQIPEDYKIYGNTILRPKGQPIAYREGESEQELLAFEKKLSECNNIVDILEY